MLFACPVCRAVPVPVALKAATAATAAPCWLSFGYLSVAGAQESSRDPADKRPLL